MKALALNLIVAVVWLLLQADASGFQFVIGYLLGFGLIALFPDPLKGRDYVRRILAASVFALIFLREFLLSSMQVVRQVLFTPVRNLRPRIIHYHTGGLTSLEALLLSHVISLTPGTTTVDVSDDRTKFILHVMDGDPDAVRLSIDQTLKKGILAFTR